MLDQRIRDHDIAIIAMSGRFPGAADVPSLWKNLENGVESFTTFTDEELRAAGVSEALISNPDYVKVRPVLDDVRGFDAQFFGYSPREAELADPQQRLFVECVWEALEYGGYGRPDDRGRVGLFGGSNVSMYMMDRLGPEAATIDEFELIIGNDKDALTTVAAYRLGLTGPAVSVQTFCSTSAVAIHMACQSLRLDECDLALAGGVCVRVPDRVGHLFVEGGQKSPDGHIRTFDRKSKGGIFGDGVGIVLLKPLRKALADRDTVLAVIRGSAMNNDGAAKFSYTAPSIVGQSTAVRAALNDADVSPRDISYVEAHGTATELGDPIEVAALTKGFRTAEVDASGAELIDRQYCGIGSVKTNVGHLDRAATVTGLIKVVEALRNEVIPPSLHYSEPNPEIDFARSPFYVAGKPVPWPRQPDRPRLAGLNGLGMGGTNVHVVVQEAPQPPVRPAPARRWQVLPMSARAKIAGEQLQERLGRHLAGVPDDSLPDVAYTLQVGRALFEHRRVGVADTPAAAAALFGGESEAGSAVLARQDPTRGRPVGFLFAGVGEHYAGMVGQLYRTEPVFRHHLDEGQRLLTALTGLDAVGPLTAERAAPAGADLAALMGRGPAADPADEPLRSTRIAQPAVFLAEYALARTLMEWGITPTVVLGYSVGEYVAACIAGVFSLSDALRLVAKRAELIDALPGGAMLAVGSTWAELEARVPDLSARGIDLTALNPGQIVVGGPADSVRELAAILREAELPCRELATTHAFHSRMLRPAARELTTWIAENVALNPPRVPYLSNLTGAEAGPDLVTDPSYWARHMCEPVRFTDGLDAALRRSDMALLEIGAGRSLGAMVRSHPACDRSRWPLIVSTLPAASEDRPDDKALADALAELWLTGVDVDWEAYQRSQGDWKPGRVPLPAYPFQRKEYWFGGDRPGWTYPTAAAPGDERDEFGELLLQPETRWLTAPVWKRRLPPQPVPDEDEAWVIFTDDRADDPIAERLVERLTAARRRFATVRPGTEFGSGPDGYRIRPGNADDVLDLFGALKREGIRPGRVVHTWAAVDASVEETVRRGTHTLVALARAAAEYGFESWKVDVVTSGVYQVTGNDVIRPERATALGPCTILPVECPGATLRVIDLDAGATQPVDLVLAELTAEHGNQTVAIRGGRSWTPDFEILEVPEGGLTPEPTTSIRPGGVYLVTGGLGGIGLALAQRLAADYRARLVLMGRTQVPQRRYWEQILADPAASDEVRRRIAGLKELEERGIEFEIAVGDVSVSADAARAVATALERFGELNGVLHAAGVPGEGMMQFKTPEDIDKVLAPKVAGTYALAEALHDVPLDFFALFSSVAAVTGALGQADYSAANLFLDSFAQGNPMPKTRVLSIGWGEWTWNGWASGLEGYEPVIRAYYEQHREKFGINFDQGWRCLLRALASSEPYTVVSTQDFSATVRGSREYTIEDIQAAAQNERGETRHARPELSTLYAPPETDAESIIAEIWSQALGIDAVGVNDNFFDLGGNSLLGVSIVAATKRALNLERLPAHMIYQAPTVAALAKLAAPPTGEDEHADQATDSDDRAKSRHKRLSQRRADRRREEH
ncbi:SDR family NAD(P)-dependent oxidoreductase [Cryptosporangium sp. NPDC051539]|uniref:type I polyketide synthase n=1 Tax=Cryptosporangium sp. NPDC051539 TaxID=3363962 RepID=UPI0037B446AF